MIALLFMLLPDFNGKFRVKSRIIITNISECYLEGRMQQDLMVTKRDGRQEQLDLEKIHKVVIWAAEGLSGAIETLVVE